MLFINAEKIYPYVSLIIRPKPTINRRVQGNFILVVRRDNVQTRNSVVAQFTRKLFHASLRIKLQLRITFYHAENQIALFHLFGCHVNKIISAQNFISRKNNFRDGIAVKPLENFTNRIRRATYKIRGARQNIKARVLDNGKLFTWHSQRLFHKNFVAILDFDNFNFANRYGLNSVLAEPQS